MCAELVDHPEDEVDDVDIRFILLWIRFNSAYTGDFDAEVNSERGAFKSYFDALVSLNENS